VSASEQTNYFDSPNMVFVRNKLEMLSGCGTSAVPVIYL